MADYIYDGHEGLSGISGANPVNIPRNLAASAVNRFFRYDENNPRPGFPNITLVYPDDIGDKQRHLFEGGNLQGATFYSAYPSYLSSYIVVSIAGTIFSIQIQGRKGYVRKIFTGNDPVMTHAWFCQGLDWLVIQDGQAQPILWNGVSARRAKNLSEITQQHQEVPTGSCMAFIHGRFVVSSSDGKNLLAIGNQVFSADVESTNDILDFTEAVEGAGGGTLGTPVFVGDITGVIPMPYLDTGTGQNDCVILGTSGAVALNIAGPRDEWLNTQLLRISLLGSGCVSTHSTTLMNGELFFRSNEGVRAYKNSRVEFEQTWKQSPISSDVRRWLSKDNRRLLQYCSMTSWENMLFCTVSPMLEAANNPFAGHHRYHRGFVVMDAEPESNTLRSGAPVWQGMWTGIRPTAFVSGRINNSDRCFAFSYDQDGVNRLYEITLNETNDTFQGSRKKIVSFYDTGSFGVIERVANNFTAKKLQGGEIELSKLNEQVAVDIKYRPDNSACYLEMDAFNVGCDCTTPTACDELLSQPKSVRKNMKQPANVCISGSNDLSRFLFTVQARIKMTGAARVDRMRFRFSREKESERVDCGTDSCERIDCCPAADEFEYHIAPEGVNTNIPEIVIPSDVPEYTAQKQVTVSCPPGSLGTPSTASAVASSVISYEDALIKATAVATLRAQQQLRCRSCNPMTLNDFVSNESTTNLSVFFDDSSYPSDYEGRPWRLIETVTDIEYASGYIDSSGTLVVVSILPGYETYFDLASKSFVDSGTTDAYMALDLGCPSTSGGAEWPEHHGPYYY